MSNFDFLKTLGLEKFGVDISGEIPETKFLDTGSYALNALISSSIYGGIPDNRIVCYTGVQQSGKTFFALSACEEFLNSDPTNLVIYFDTEHALDKNSVAKRLGENSRFQRIPIKNVEQLKFTVVRIVTDKLKNPKMPKMMFVVDSLGELPSVKEITDALAAESKVDMTRAKEVKSFFRTTTGILGDAGIPLIVVNHVYDITSGNMAGSKEISGGSGFKYSASSIVMFAPLLEKDKEERSNSLIIRATMYKSRFSKPKQSVEMRLHLKTGIDRFYGLVPIAEEYGIFKKVSTRYELPDGSKQFESAIYKDPERFFTKDVLDRIDEAAYKKFSVGSGSDNDEPENLPELEEDDDS